MPRRVFFSFHYDDILAVNIVRQSNKIRTQYDPSARSFFDKGLWEKVKLRGSAAIKAEIDKGLQGSSVTCLLIGKATWQRPWVRYEILASLARGNGLLGIHIHDVGPRSYSLLAAHAMLGQPVTPGANPYEYVGFRIGIGLFPNVELLHYHKSAWRVNPELGFCSPRQLPRFLQQCSVAVLSSHVPIYHWTKDGGYENVHQWIEYAAHRAGH